MINAYFNIKTYRYFKGYYVNSIYNKLAKFEKIGSKALEIMRESAFSPIKKKILRHWGITEAAILIGKTKKTIREHEKKGTLDKAKREKSNNKRYYTLDDINKIREYFNVRPKKPNNVPPSIIAFANFKGGVAKTTNALHSAHFFSKKGYRVLLIDADSQASTTSSFGYAPDEHILDNETLLPIFLGKTNCIKKSIKKTYWSGLDLIPANLKLYEIELELPILRNKAANLGEIFYIYDILDLALKQVYELYDIIIIDCPPSMSILNTNALFASNTLIIPCLPQLPDIASMIQFFGMIKGTITKTKKNNYDLIRILIARNNGSKDSNTIVAILRKIYGRYIMRSEMLETQVIQKARLDMRSIYELSKYKGSKYTLNRAYQIMDDINKELEEEIHISWNNYIK